jgi:hypothetical protein
LNSRVKARTIASIAGCRVRTIRDQTQVSLDEWALTVYLSIS